MEVEETLDISNNTGFKITLNMSIEELSKISNIDDEKKLINLEFKDDTLMLFKKYLELKDENLFMLKEECKKILIYDKFEDNLQDKNSVKLLKGLNYFILVESIKLAELFNIEELHTFLCAFIAHYYKNLKYNQLHDTFLVGSSKFTGDELKAAVLLTPTLNDYCNNLLKE